MNLGDGVVMVHGLVTRPHQAMATGGLGEGVVQLQRGDPARGWIISH